MPLLSWSERSGSNTIAPQGSIREQLLDFISNVSPGDTPLWDNLGMTTVRSDYVE